MMTEETLSCDFCFIAIAPGDFDKGRAVRLMGKRYCNACLTRAIEKSRNADAPPDLMTPWPSNRFSSRRSEGNA